MKNINHSKKITYKQAFTISFINLILGLLLDFLTSGEGIKIPQAPFNIFILLGIIVLIMFLHLILGEKKVVKHLSSVPFAISSISVIFVIVLLMGFIPQTEISNNNFISKLSLNNLKNSYLLAINSLFILISLGLVTLRRLIPITKKNIGFFINHFGLWLIISAGYFGSSDIIRLKMVVTENEEPVWYAQNDEEEVFELPIAIKLIDFDIEEYPPKIAIVDNKTANIAENIKNNLVETETNTEIKIGKWNVKIKDFFQNSVRVNDKYVEYLDKGACASALIEISDKEEFIIEKWISSGSYLHAQEFIELDENYSLFLLKPEPKRYYSELKLFAQDGTIEKDTLVVNKPIKFKNWTLYQLSYDNTKGRWSEYSVLELVKDPWLPIIYIGLFLVLIGSIYLFWLINKKL